MDTAHTKTPQVDVVIVNYNGGDMLARAVRHLLAQRNVSFRAVVVDNASTDGSADHLPDDPRLHVHRLPENTGFARANNVGAGLGTAPWIACLNPDAYPDPDWLATLLQAVAHGPDLAMAGSAQISAQNPAMLDGAGDQYAPYGFAWRGLYGHPLEHLPETGEVFGPCAAAALYRRDLFEALGGFDEDFFCYHEDVDLAFRMRLAGGKCVQVKEAQVHHEGSGISGTESDFAIFHGVRNRMWTFAKNMPVIPFIMFLPLHVGMSLAFLLRAAIKGRLAATWRGTMAGVGGLPRMWGKRKAVQKARTARTLDCLRIMTWSPVKFLTRGVKVRRF